MELLLSIDGKVSQKAVFAFAIYPSLLPLVYNPHEMPAQVKCSAILVLFHFLLIVL